MIGTSAPIIGSYECNEIKPSIKVTQKLADALEVTIDHLISGANMVADKKLMKKLENIHDAKTRAAYNS